MATYAIQTTRRVAYVEADSAEQARDIFLGRAQSAAEMALGPFPDFDLDPDGWRAHLARFFEIRADRLDWSHGECLLGSEPVRLTDR